VKQIFERIYGESFLSLIEVTHEIFFKRMKIALPKRMFALRELIIPMSEGDVLYVNDRSLFGMTAHSCYNSSECSGYQLYCQGHLQKVSRTDKDILNYIGMQRECESAVAEVTPSRFQTYWNDPSISRVFFTQNRNNEDRTILKRGEANGSGSGEVRKSRFDSKSNVNGSGSGGKRGTLSRKDGSSTSSSSSKSGSSREEKLLRFQEEMKMIGLQQVLPGTIAPRKVIAENEVERGFLKTMFEVHQREGRRSHPPPPILANRWCHADLHHPEQKAAFRFDLSEHCRYSKEKYVRDMTEDSLTTIREGMERLVHETTEELKSKGIDLLHETNDLPEVNERVLFWKGVLPPSIVREKKKTMMK